MHKQAQVFLFILSFISLSSLAQETTTDTIKTQLEEVVVTGQIEPQSIKKSVQNVRIISKENIKQLAANNLSDVLNQYININLQPSGTTGRSTVSMFGLNALYFKILIDNVPIVNEAGLGNNIDVSQINLNDVERIEIIEGSMGVTHGANAVSGILNIITKKSSLYNWEVSATLQEETVGDEFAFFDKGRHIQALKVSHNISDNWFVSVNANRNDFAGWYDDRQGKDYFLTDSLRGYKWLPKDQLLTNAMVSYNNSGFRAFYRFEMFNEDTDYYNNNVEPGINTEFGPYRATTDARYYIDRFYHHLNANGKMFSQLFYNVSLSHQKQKRDVESFRYFIEQDIERGNRTVTNQSMEVLYSTGTVSNFFKDKRVNLQVGYELTNNNGFTLVQEADNQFRGVRERLENYDFFSAAEITLSERFSLRPGLRYSIQSQFEDQYASSLGFRYSLNNGVEVRGALGNSFRTPTFEELYYRQIFSGHYFIGNENLVPEKSTSYEVSIRKATSFASGLMLANNLVGTFMDVDDKIDTAFAGFAPEDNTPMYKAINISKYRTWNLSTTNQLQYKSLTVNLGATVLGVSQQVDNGFNVSDDKFFYTLNLNASASYRVPRWNTVFAAYYKYNGKFKQYESTLDDFILTEIGDSNWLDASASKPFFKDRLEVTVGARNILNVTDVTKTGVATGGSHSASGSILQAYGRSYFAKLTYNLNF